MSGGPHEATAALLADLYTWSEDVGSSHGDRELADRVLLATGWRWVADEDHPAKVRWEFGTNPVYMAWEPTHPHPIRSIDAAIGQLPFRWRICSIVQSALGAEWCVEAEGNGAEVCATHATLPVAICLVAVKAWALRGRSA